jgi:ABC-type branched-subunit amino acid transport system ATPase component
MSPSSVAGAALTVDEVSFSYGQLQVLFGVSLEVRQGEALALLGTNGAGKSTLLKVVTGLETASSGSVIFDGKNITPAAAERLPGSGLLLVVGGKSVFTDMTVDENLEMQALAVRRSSSQVKDRLDVVFSTFPRLAERRAQKAGTLSGGEQQQLALAKALLLDPKLLCIDELSLGLAPVVVGQLLEVLRRLHATGVTLLVVEQSLNIAAELCERCIFLEKGEVRFEGSTRDLMARDDIARAVFLGSKETTPASAPTSRGSRQPVEGTEHPIQTGKK